MKLRKIIIKGFRQFQEVEFDFTNPFTNLPVDKICFIGRNGTGKSTLLNEIQNAIYSLRVGIDDTRFVSHPSIIHTNGLAELMVFIYQHHDRYIHQIFSDHIDFMFCFISDKEEIRFVDVKKLKSANDIKKFLTRIQLENVNDLRAIEPLFSNENFLSIYSPAESSVNSYLTIVDVPETNLSDALQHNSKEIFHQVSQHNLTEFWRRLIYLIRDREEGRNIFENSPSNVNKTKKTLIEEYDKINPEILSHLAIIWNKILNRCGLYFDYENARIPAYLNDNLRAYIRLLEGNASKNNRLNYNQLSTGIRNFIFRLGHIYSLYFNKRVQNAFLLIDEPENSLYPDFLFDLLETYGQVTSDIDGNNNTQVFFSTHNPIIAAQFEPYERIVLEWTEDYSVFAKKGFSPIGDDPNDVLSNDFELKNLLGPEGRKQWEKFIDLKKKLIRSTDETEKSILIHEIEKIGSLYNFS